MTQDGGFMFAFHLYGFNLSNYPKLFDFTFYQDYFTYGYTLINRTQIPLVQCTEDHFGLNLQLKNKFNNLGFSQAICPPLGQELSV